MRLLACGAGIFFSLATISSTFATTIPHYVEPSYSNLSVGYTQAKLDAYSDTASDISFRIEQQVMPNMFVQGSYADFSESIGEHPIALQLEDMQVGVGWFERSEVGPHVDLSVLLGRETIHTPDLSNPDNSFFDESDYFGVQLGLRESHGPLEVQAALGYFFHDGNRDDQFRWELGAYLTVVRNVAVGLRYQDHEDYSLRSLELRIRW